MNKTTKQLMQRIQSLERIVSTANDPRSVFSSSDSKQGLSGALGLIRCVCGGNINTYDPVFVTSSGDGSNLSTVYQYNGSYELSEDRGLVGVAQQSGISGDVITVSFSGTTLVAKATGTVLLGGDLVWLDDSPYVEKQDVASDISLTTNSGGITNFQVVQDARSGDSVVYVKFLTDIQSRAVPIQITLAPDDDVEDTESNKCNVYPFGPESSVVIHKYLTVKLISDLAATFPVGEWRMATIIGDIAYVGESAGSAVGEPIQITDVNYALNNGDGVTKTYIYKTAPVDSILSSTLIAPSEDSKTNTQIIDGYPWNLQVGDNLIKIGTNGDESVYYANNTISPDPIIKIVAGTPEVYDKEDSGSKLTDVRPGYRIMSNPGSLTLATYNDLFLMAQWSKKDKKVRINIPVI